MTDVQEAVRDGSFDPRLLVDERLYREELDKVFRRTWLYIGHESQIPNPGDYLVNSMGEEEVMVLKDVKGRIRAYKNWCPHRGNKVCLFDRGNARAFTCTFHGWTFDTEGKLIGLAAGKEVYGALEPHMRETKRLLEIPRLSTYAGMIFASWDPEIASLDDYLGDLRPYLDVIVGRPWAKGGVEILPGRARWIFPINWKAMSENWMSDDYHVWSTHPSVFRLGKGGGAVGEFLSSYASPDWTMRHTVNVLVDSPTGVSHGLGAMTLWGDPREGTIHRHEFIEKQGRVMAGMLGPDAVEWYDESHARITEYFEKEGTAKFLAIGNGTVFPNLSLELLDIVLGGSTLIQWHPRGASTHEGWQWVLVDREAPASVKRYAQQLVNFGQSPAGMIMIDDTENFERARDNILTALSRNDTMEKLALSNEAPGNAEYLEDFTKAGIDLKRTCPTGEVLPGVQEKASRAFYRAYKNLMVAP